MDDLLFLCHRIPYPPDKGDKIRAWPILRHLAASHRVHLGCFMDDPADAVHLPTLRTICADVLCVPLHPRRQKLRALAHLRPGRAMTLAYFRDARLEHWVDDLFVRRRVARVFAFSSGIAPYALRHPAPVRILDMVDIDSEKWLDYAAQRRWPARLLWAREGRTLLAFERHAAAAFDRTLFVSEDESLRFAALAPECLDRIGWIENGVDLERFSPMFRCASPFGVDASAIVFTGTMDYWPNASAVIWFAQEVMPALREMRPAAEFHVVGANPGREVRQLAGRPGVHVSGRVVDTRPYIAHASAVVAPLKLARGIQNKVLEAMAMGKPVVASPQAFEGIRAIPGRDLLVAESADETAAAVNALLDGKHPGLGRNARAVVEASYGWPAKLAQLDSLLQVNETPRAPLVEAQRTGLPA